MKPRICRCCGEPMSEEGNTLSRNPNVCASCSSMADGMEGGSLMEISLSLPQEAASVPLLTEAEALGEESFIRAD